MSDSFDFAFVGDTAYLSMAGGSLVVLERQGVHWEPDLVAAPLSGTYRNTEITSYGGELFVTAQERGSGSVYYFTDAGDYWDQEPVLEGDDEWGPGSLFGLAVDDDYKYVFFRRGNGEIVQTIFAYRKDAEWNLELILDDNSVSAGASMMTVKDDGEVLISYSVYGELWLGRRNPVF